MTVLSEQLTKISPDQRLLVLKGDPTHVWEWVFNEWQGVTHLVYEIVSPLCVSSGFVA